jgi:uncharacterized protein YggE
MKRLLAATIFSFSLFALLTILARSQTENESQTVHNHVISVSRGGEAYGKPDLGIMVMTIRSTAPIAEEAVAENGRKAKAVESALAALGYAPQGYKISSVTFGHAGGRSYGPAQPEMVAYEASQFVYVFFEASDLSDMARLTEKTAAVIEALRKAGAVPGDVEGPRLPTSSNALIIYTMKDSEQYERQALQQAIGRARDAAQDIAKAMGVQITGLRNITSGYLGGNYMPRSGNTALEGLPYRFYSTKSDEVRIHANATVDYDFK